MTNAKIVAAPLLVILAALLTLAGSQVTAETKRKSFDRHSQITSQRGTFKRSTQQRAYDNGFERRHQTTLANGQTRSIEKHVTRDKDNQTRTLERNGTRLNGASFLRITEQQRTENGYTSNSTRSNADGSTISRNVVAEFDRENGTASKEITRTNREGETHTRTITRSVSQADK